MDCGVCLYLVQKKDWHEVRHLLKKEESSSTQGNNPISESEENREKYFRLLAKEDHDYM